MTERMVTKVLSKTLSSKNFKIILLVIHFTDHHIHESFKICFRQKKISRLDIFAVLTLQRSSMQQLVGFIENIMRNLNVCEIFVPLKKKSFIFWSVSMVAPSYSCVLIVYIWVRLLSHLSLMFLLHIKLCSIRSISLQL